MLSVPRDIQERLRAHGQDHVLGWWPRLDDSERRHLLEQLRCLDLDLLKRLFAQREHSFALPAPERIAPVPVIRPGKGDEAARRCGAESLQRGEVAALVVAGGQGSRLGFEHPKGMFPVGPVTDKSLFQIHAEKVLALGRRHGKPVPLLIMTSARSIFRSQDRGSRTLSRRTSDRLQFASGSHPAIAAATGSRLERPAIGRNLGS